MIVLPLFWLALFGQSAAPSVPAYPVQLQNLASGNCIQAMGVTNSARVETYPCAATPAQLWMFSPQPNGSYDLVPQTSALTINTIANSFAAGAGLQMYAYGAAYPNEQWIAAQATTPGYITLTQVGNGQCIDASGGSRVPGAKVQQYTCGPTNPNQQWRIVSVNQVTTTQGTYSLAPALYDPAAPIPSASFGTGSGATITWYHDPGATLPAFGDMEGQTIWGVLSQPATATAYGTLADGTLAQLDSTHVKFAANQSILPCHTVEGLQTLPCDMIFFTRVDSLPWISSHSIGDGSGYAEDSGKYDKLVQGDPYAGTGWYQAVGPVNSTCITKPGGTVYTGRPGSILGGGSPSGTTWQTGYDCHVVFPASGINFGPTVQPTILDGTEPMTWMGKAVYPSFNGPFPDVRGKFQELRESGEFTNPANNCNVTGLLAANPPFHNCPPGGTQPFYPSTGGIDTHEFLLNPFTYQTWDVYSSELFGAFSQCQVGGMTCTLGSARKVEWSDYAMPPGAIGAAGTPETQLQLTLEDMREAAIDPVKYPITHAFSLTEPLFSLARGGNGNSDVWPSTYFSGPVSYNNYGTLEGARKRLDPARASLQGGLSSVVSTNLGSGYTPGQVFTGAVTGCQSIDGIHPASVIAFVGTGGSVEKNPSGGQVFEYINNTGQNCVSPTVSFPAPVSGTTATATLTVWNLASYSQAEQNMLQALYNQATQYGMEVDDVGFGSNESFRTDAQLNNPAYGGYRKAAGDFYASTAQGMGDGMLWGWVDTSSLIPSGGNWPSGMQTKSWMVDATNPLEGSSVQHQNVIKLTTPSGIVSLNPLPVIGVGVTFNIPNIANQVNIVAGTSAVNLGQYAHVTGDATNAGVTFSWITDPCPNMDSLTAAGVYTPCPTVTGLASLSGEMQVASVANPAAFAPVSITVLPGFDSTGTLSIDVGGSGGYVNGTAWNADCQSCFYWTSPTGSYGDYPHWPWATWGGPAAPQSVAGESSIYQSYTYGDPDLTMSVMLPNGNYSIRAMVGSTNRGGSNNTQTSVLLPYYGSSSIYTTQGQVQRWAFCMYCQSEYTAGQPVDITLPAKVTDGILKIGMYGYSPTRWGGWDKTAHFGTSSMQSLSGIQIRKDSTTVPHWEIGSYVPGAPGGVIYDSGAGVITGTGDNFTIPLWNGTPYSPLGAPQPGILQLYQRDVLTGVSDPVWSVVGSGTITSAGMYTAPLAMPATCDTVTATSASQPSISASQQVCFTAP